MTLITRNIQLLTQSRNFELLSRYFELLGEMLRYCCILRNVEIKSFFLINKLIFGDIILIFRVISQNFALICIENEQ